MITLFWIIFLGTGVIIRTLTHLIHNPNDYYGRTITGYLRGITRKEIHHIHLGFFLTIISIFLIFINGLTNFFIILLAIGLSLISDQIFPLMNLSDYFNKKGIYLAILTHLVIGTIMTVILYIT